MRLAIYGAQGMALATYDALKTLYPQREISCFLVTTMGYNRPVLGDIPVKELAIFANDLSLKDKDDFEILIATPENVQFDIEETLEDYGFRHHQRLDSKRWSELMKLYHARMGIFMPLAALPIGCHEPFIRIFVAKSVKDRELRKSYELPDCMVPIQVGVELCDSRISDFQDNIGDNISKKNDNYCELTALYWIWKNRLLNIGRGNASKNQYYGLAQYRRILLLDKDDMLRLLDNDVDVVLPYPMPYEPNISAHHMRYLKDSDWNALLTALNELQPKYAQYLPKLLEQKYLYNYNIVLAKKFVLNEYCEWLFPILERVEEISLPPANERHDRYIGYMGETLETLYFLRNADRLNIVHTECRFLV